LAGASTADSLALSSTGAIANAAGASLGVTNNAAFSGSSITLGNQAGNAMNFGSLTFSSAGAVSIAEDSATHLTGTTTADTLAPASTGSTATAAASLSVTNTAAFSRPSVPLGNQAGDTMIFGSLTFSSAGAVSIPEASPIQLAGASTADSLALSSTGAIANAA